MSEPQRPIIVKAGKRTKKAINKLKNGEGRLAEEVREAVNDALLIQGSKAAPNEYLTCVIIYERKPKKQKMPAFQVMPLFPFRR